MPNVPNVPGVPILTSYSPVTPVLALSDAAAILSQFSASISPQWYIQDQVSGEIVIQPATPATQFLSPITSLASLITPLLGIGVVFPVIASFIEFEYRQDFPIATYPIEAGSFQSYDRITLPFDLRVRIASGGTTAQRQAFLTAIQQIASTLDTFTVFTPDGLYTSLSLSHYNFRRTADRGVTLITVDLFFQQILATGATTVTTASAANAATTGGGITQANPVPNSSVQSVPQVNPPISGSIQ